MAKRVDLFDSTYSNFTEEVLDAIRKETFGTDIGQNSWLTVDEYERWLPWLSLKGDSYLLEVASGSGGPARYVARTTGCHVIGIDANESGVATASQLAAEEGDSDRVSFRVADATAPLPFVQDSFDALLCIDSMNHFPNRLAVFREWSRVLRPGGRAIFTDPVLITGPVTNDELAGRSSIGLFLFVPPGVNERLIQEAGFRLVRRRTSPRTRPWFRSLARRTGGASDRPGPDRGRAIRRPAEIFRRSTPAHQRTALVAHSLPGGKTVTLGCRITPCLVPRLAPPGCTTGAPG
jgi:SAM-dependent methyltransferase